MRRILALIAVLCLAAGISSAASISGYVENAQSGEAILGANVFIGQTGQGAATNLEGFFLIRNLPPDAFTLRFSHIAYRDSAMQVIPTGQNVFLGRIGLCPRSIRTEAIEVTGRRNTIIERELDISSFEVAPEVLMEIPQLSKDVFQMIKYTPSVTISDPFSPQYYVRGSDPGENLVQLDGMTIYNPQHFMGSGAIFNPYAIKDIEMLVGGFDAQYGGRNSSILNISTREGHQHEWHGEFKPGISGISGAVEFPVSQSSTAMLSGRLHSNLSYRVLMGVPNLMADFNGAYRVQWGKTELRFSSFYARDYMDYSIDNLMLFFPDTLLDEMREGFVTNTSNAAAGVHLNTLLFPNLMLEAQAYYSGSQVDNQTYFGYAFEDTNAAVDAMLDFKTRIENSISDYTLKTQLNYFTFWNQTVQFGFEANQLHFTNRVGQLEINSPTQRSRLDIQSLFLQDRLEIDLLLLKLGLRLSRSVEGMPWRREPRLSAALRLGTITLKAAYGHYYQYLTTMDSKSNEFVQFLDYYSALGKLDPLHSVHHIIGLEGRLTETLEYSATAYYKDLRNLYRYSYDQGYLYGAQENGIDQGSGESYGFELLLRGEVGRLSGWISYAYSHGSRNYPSILNGKTILYDGDQPHNLKMLLLYKLTEDITASSSFQFTSGYPKTWETGMYFHYQYDPLSNTLGGFPTSITPAKNNVRYPPRLAWEIGWKKKLRSGFGYHLAEYLGTDDAVFTMTIRNILFLHRNPQWYFYLPDYGYYALDFEFFPSVNASYSIRF